MYGGGGFGGFGGFGDMMGGFFPSPQKPGGGSSPARISRTAEFGAPGGRDVQGLIPVTIKMILEASSQGEGSDVNSILRFHGNHEASQVEIIGLVEAAETLNDQMFARYVVDDGTGKLICKKFIENTMASRDPPSKISVGKFVRVIGPFRRFGAESYINAHRLEEVRVLDDITRHRIEVIHAMLQLNGNLDESQHSGAVSMQSASMTSASDFAPRHQESMSN